MSASDGKKPRRRPDWIGLAGSAACVIAAAVWLTGLPLAPVVIFLLFAMPLSLAIGRNGFTGRLTLLALAALAVAAGLIALLFFLAGSHPVLHAIMTWPGKH